MAKKMNKGWKIKTISSILFMGDISLITESEEISLESFKVMLPVFENEGYSFRGVSLKNESHIFSPDLFRTNKTPITVGELADRLVVIRC